MSDSVSIVVPPQGVQVWVDFDNTVTTQDVLDHLIAGYAVDEAWRAAEAEWGEGKIGSFECLSRQFACIRISPIELEMFLGTIRTDPGLLSLLSVLTQAKREGMADFAILSDGVGSFIRTVLGRVAGVGGIGVSDEVTIRSNEIEHEGERLMLKCPLQDRSCTSAAAHCKCASARSLSTPGRPWIYIGDGRSDLCPARQCQVVFAKGALARYLRAEGRAFISFETLEDVAAFLKPAFARAAEARSQSGVGS
jgi:2,3-diketo-5-methylthio-1-phosphopentane phosphatase